MKTGTIKSAAATKAVSGCQSSGFTLIEVLIAAVLVGIAIASLVAASRAYTQVNGASLEITTAEFLIDQIHELMVTLGVADPQSGTTTFGPELGEGSVTSYDDLDDFDGASFSPPINSCREQMNDLAAYTQEVIVQNVNPTNFEDVEDVVDDKRSDFVRVTVRILHNGQEIGSRHWLRAKY